MIKKLSILFLKWEIICLLLLLIYFFFEAFFLRHLQLPGLEFFYIIIAAWFSIFLYVLLILGGIASIVLALKEKYSNLSKLLLLVFGILSIFVLLYRFHKLPSTMSKKELITRIYKCQVFRLKLIGKKTNGKILIVFKNITQIPDEFNEKIRNVQYKGNSEYMILRVQALFSNFDSFQYTKLKYYNDLVIATKDASKKCGYDIKIE